MTYPITPICYKCKHFDYERRMLCFECKAYSNGIPDEIIDGEVDHTKPYKDDNGIQFEPIKE